MSVFCLTVRRIERVALKGPTGHALASANADFRLWNIARREPLTPVERRLRSLRSFRIRTTNDGIAFGDGTYPEEGVAFGSGWTRENEHGDKAMPQDQLLRLVRTSDSYVTHLGGLWPDGFLNIQHPDGPKWFREAALAGDKKALRLDLRLRRESESWMRQEPQANREKAFLWRHPLFFDVTSADIISK